MGGMPGTNVIAMRRSSARISSGLRSFRAAWFQLFDEFLESFDTPWVPQPEGVE